MEDMSWGREECEGDELWKRNLSGPDHVQGHKGQVKRRPPYLGGKTEAPYLGGLRFIWMNKSSSSEAFLISSVRFNVQHVIPHVLLLVLPLPYVPSISMEIYAGTIKCKVVIGLDE